MRNYWNGVGENKTQAFVTNDAVMTKEEAIQLSNFTDLETYDNEELSFTNDFIRDIERYYHQVIDNIPDRDYFSGGDRGSIVMDCEDLFSDELIKEKVRLLSWLRTQVIYLQI